MINYNKLWTLISEYNLTKTEFMNQLGVSSATFAKLSSNQPVTMEVLEKICNILGCLVYIELWAQEKYQHKISKAVNEYKMISSNYSKILMNYSDIYSAIVNDFGSKLI